MYYLNMVRTLNQDQHGPSLSGPNSEVVQILKQDRSGIRLVVD